MAAVAATYAALTASQPKPIAPQCRHRRQPRPTLGADNAVVERLVAERRLGRHADSACGAARRHRPPTSGSTSGSSRWATWRRNKGETVLDAAGGTVIPGLHDHHVHLRSAAAALTSARVGPAEVRGRADLARALAAPPVGSDGWIRAVGYHEAVAGPLDRDAARRAVAAGAGPRAAPQRRAVDPELGGLGQGRAARSPRRPPAQCRPQLVGHVAAQRDWTRRGQPRLLGYGVTGVTDATPDLEVGDIVKLIAGAPARRACVSACTVWPRASGSCMTSISTSTS